MRIVDSHVHLWEVGDGRRPWLTPALGALYRSFRACDLRDRMKAAGVSSALLVESSDHPDEDASLAEQANGLEWMAGYVGAFGQPSDGLISIKAMAARGAKGIRLNALAHDDEWLCDAKQGSILAVIESGELTLDLLVDPRHLPSIETIARRHPAMTIVIDHGARPPADPRAWADAIARTAGETTAFCKLSGLNPPRGSASGWSSDVCQTILTAFGAKRVLWGSDWPIVEQTRTYASWLHEAQDIVRTSDHAASDVFERTARRAYRLAA